MASNPFSLAKLVKLKLHSSYAEVHKGYSDKSSYSLPEYICTIVCPLAYDQCIERSTRLEPDTPGGSHVVAMWDPKSTGCLC